MTRVVRRYGAGRLYDAAVPGYTDAAGLRALRSQGAEVVVLDAATGADVTLAVLAQG